MKKPTHEVPQFLVTVDEAASKGQPYALTTSGERISRKLLDSVVRIDALHASPSNVRTHGAKNIDAIKRSLTKFGQQHPVIYSSATGEVLAGNGRLESMRQLGWTCVAAVPFDGTARQAKAYAIADNRSAELADWDWRGLSDQLKDLLNGDGYVGEDLGFDEHDLQPLLNADWRPDAMEDLSSFQNSDENGAADGREGADSRTIAFTPECYAVVKRAIERYREVTEDKVNDQLALAGICERYVAGTE